MKKLFGSLIMLALISLMMVAPAVYAVDNDVEPILDTDLGETLETLGRTLVSFVIASLIWAFTGFFKIKDPPPSQPKEVFDPVQFFTTLIVGVVTGLLAFVIYETTGESLTPTAIWQYLLAAGFVAFVESWIKVVWRRVKPYFTPPTA